MSLSTHRLAASAILGLALSLSVSAQIAPPASERPSVSPAAERLNLGLRGIYFVENHGQWSDDFVHFGLKSRGLDVAFRESSFTMHLSREVERASRPFDEATTSEASPKRERGCSAFDDPDPLPHGRGSLREPVAYEHLTLTVSFPGSNPVTPRGAQEQAAKFNYFVGGDGRGAASNVPSFGAVVYENLYDGVDLHVMGNDDGVMKYEFHCEPGADYTQIRIHYDGIDSLCVNADGDLEIATSFGTLRDGAPIVWQEGAGSTSRAREEAAHHACRPTPLAATRDSFDSTIPARFEVIDDYTYRIVLEGPVDLTRAIIIDPEVKWVYFIGGRGSDYFEGIAVDNAGHAILTGYTASEDFIGRNNFHHGFNFDSFVVKTDSTGIVLWMTYLGGSRSDTGRDVVVREDGRIFASGETNSTDFEGRSNSYHGGVQDCFVASIGPSGHLMWMTYLGGAGIDSDAPLAIGANTTLLVAGQTSSTDWKQATNTFHGGSHDAFLVSVDQGGTVQWMTYIGGTDFEEAQAVAVHSIDGIIVSGRTESNDLVGRTNSYYGNTDAFATRVSASGSIIWTVYLGGPSSFESGVSICTDQSADVIVCGYTRSHDFEGRINSPFGDYDGFALRLSSSGSLLWMAYLGGTGIDDCEKVITTDDGSIFIAGTTLSWNFIGRTNYYRRNQDAYLLKMTATGQVEWMNYIGGSERESRVSIALDSTGDMLVGGSTSSGDFPGHRNQMYDKSDVFLQRMSVEDDAALDVESSCPQAGPIEIGWSGTTPGGDTAILFAPTIRGAFTIPLNSQCAGTYFDLSPHGFRLVWTGSSDPQGMGSAQGSISSAACGGYLQLLDLTTCGTSNVARIE
ncbi:MAG: SBBP repeat-containing protein [Phycisphaerales bacterium]|nr:SBBP repeat-containing protein [Phycisphaerales bacterium]